MASIQGIYIALFGRPADPLGLDYFNEVTGEGADLTAIGDLAATAEYQDRFEGMSNVQIINSIYQSLFGRDADLAGLTFFAQALQDGTFNINNIAIAILDGAQGDDLAVVNNKIDAANAFTAAIDTGTEVVAYQGAVAADAGRAFLEGITADEATIPDAAEIDAAIAAITDNGGVPGDVFTLTTAIGEIVEGTEGNDTFNVIADGAGQTLNTFDSINGRGGVDTLNLVTTTAAATLPTAAQMSGVERIAVDAGVEVTALDASALADVTDLIVGGAGATAVTLGEGQSVTLANSAATVGGVTVTVDADETDTTITLDGVVTAEAVTLVGAASTTLNVDGSVAGAGATALTINAAATTTTLNVDLSSDTVLTLTGVAITSIDASGSTGDLTIVATAAAETVLGGSGDDTITGGAATTSIEAGAGADTITLGALATDVIINAGDSGLTLATTDKITGFTTGTDDLDFNLVAGSATNFLFDGSAGGYLDALVNANAAFGADAALTYVAVSDGTDSWVFVDSNDDGSADMAVQLTGVTAVAFGDIIA